MAVETPCQTDGANFTTHITNRGLVVIVDFGRFIELNEEEATVLDANIHNALELVLAPYFKESNEAG